MQTSKPSLSTEEPRSLRSAFDKICGPCRYVADILGSTCDVRTEKCVSAPAWRAVFDQTCICMTGSFPPPGRMFEAPSILGKKTGRQPHGHVYQCNRSQMTKIRKVKTTLAACGVIAEQYGAFLHAAVEVPCF